MAARRHYVLVSAHYPPYTGGIPTFVEHLAKQLVSQGHYVDVLTSQLSEDDVPREQISDHFVIWRIPTHALMGGRLPLVFKNEATASLLERFSNSLVQAAGSGERVRFLVNARFYDLSQVGVRLAHDLGFPCIVLDHGSAYLSIGNRAANMALRIYEKRRTAALQKLGKPSFAGISSASCTWLNTFHISTNIQINNAIDAVGYRAFAAKRSFRDELNIAPQSFLVVQVARLIPEKGTNLVLEAAAALPQVQFVIAGDGPLRSSAERFAFTHKNVHYVGALSPSEVSALFSQANLHLLPSRSEGMPTSVLEAGAWGVPSATTNVGGVKDILPEEAWLTLMEQNAESVIGAIEAAQQKQTANPKLVSDLKKHIQKWFSWAHTAQQLNDAFEAIEKMAER